MITRHRVSVVAVVAAALAVAGSAAPAMAQVTGQTASCSSLTVTITDRAEIPAGMSVRALQEGRNYPAYCR